MPHNRFADFIRGRRAELGLTLSELSSRCGFPRAAITDMETGQKPPDLILVPGLATVLHRRARARRPASRQAGRQENRTPAGCCRPDGRAARSRQRHVIAGDRRRSSHQSGHGLAAAQSRWQHPETACLKKPGKTQFATC